MTAPRIPALGPAVAGLLVATIACGIAGAEQAARCPGGDWLIIDGEAGASESICQGVAAATAFFEACGIPTPEAATVRVVETLPLVCDRPAHGVFDAAGREITVATRGACLDAIMPGDLFDRLDTDAAYRSVVAHEAAHLILQAARLDTASFLEHEYIAGIVQLEALGDGERARLIADLGIAGPVADTELSSTIYGFDPLRFAAKAYLHHAGQADPCQHLRAMVVGDVRLWHHVGE